MAPRERNALIALVKTLVVERGVSVLFTEHSMDVVFAFADRILVMARGRLIADGDAKTIRADPLVREVYFGSGRTFEQARAVPCALTRCCAAKCLARPKAVQESFLWHSRCIRLLRK